MRNHTHTHKPMHLTKILTHILVTHFIRTNLYRRIQGNTHAIMYEQALPHLYVNANTDNSCVQTHHACIHIRTRVYIHAHVYTNTDVHTETSKVEQTYSKNDITYKLRERNKCITRVTHSLTRICACAHTQAHMHT